MGGNRNRNSFVNQHKDPYSALDKVALQHGEGGHLDGAADDAAEKGRRAAGPEAADALLRVDLPEAVAHSRVAVLVADGDRRIGARLQVALDQVEGVAEPGARWIGEGWVEIEIETEHLRNHQQTLTTTRDRTGKNRLREDHITTATTAGATAKKARIVEGLVGAEAAAVHQELVAEGGDEALLQGAHRLGAGHRVEGLQDVAVVDGVLAAGQQLALQLNAHLDHLQRIRDGASAHGSQSAQGDLFEGGGLRLR